MTQMRKKTFQLSRRCLRGRALGNRLRHLRNLRPLRFLPAPITDEVLGRRHRANPGRYCCAAKRAA